MQREASEQVVDLQTRLSAHESDLARLRAARDELKAETSELRAKETDKLRALDELKTLAQARKSRLQAYESELRRVRIGKAADRGDVEGVDLRVREADAKAAPEAAAAEAGGDDEMEEGEVEVGEDDVVGDLSARLKKAEGLLLALRDQLNDYAAQDGGMPAPSAQQLIDSETRARADLAEARQRVERLEALLGPGGRADVKEMAERLEEKQRELKVAQAQVKGQEAVRPLFLLPPFPSATLAHSASSCRPRTCSTARSTDSRRRGSRSTSRTRPRSSTSPPSRTRSSVSAPTCVPLSLSLMLFCMLCTSVS